MDLNAQVKYAAEQAVSMAKESNIDLDYSNESIELVEDILQTLHTQMNSAKPSDEMIGNMANMYGAYIGETLIKNLGFGTWVAPSEGPAVGALALDLKGELVMLPSKVHRRLTNGPEDSVVQLYQLMYKKYSE